jgi:4-diphosphocytidyl-2-C-methyl-D-erythritol kinase
LNKRVPSGAGLGGGSSDAAAALAGLNRLWKLGYPASRLAEIGATMGSDIPFFLHGPSSVCSGRGEVVRPVPPPDMGREHGSAWAVLVLPKIELATPAVYRRFDEMKLGRDEHLAVEPDWSEWSRLPAADLMARLVNDLEPPAFDLSPPLKELKEALEHGLGRIVRMSGSGSSLFTLCDGGADEAEAIARRFRDMLMVDAIAVPLAPDARSG